MIRLLQIALTVAIAPATAWFYRPVLRDSGLFALAHPMLAALVLVVFGFVYGLIGAGYGLPGLFWHDRLRTRLGAATAATMLLALVGILAFYASGTLSGPIAGPDPALINTMLRKIAPSLAVGEAADNAARLGRFLLTACPPFLALLIAPALLPEAFPRVPRSVPDVLISRDRVGPTVGKTMSIASNPAAYALNLVVWLGGVALGVAIVALLLSAAYLPIPLPAAWQPGRGLPDSLRSLIMFAVVFAATYAVLSFKPIYEHIVSPAFAICALFGLLATAYAMAFYFFPWSAPGYMTLAVLIGVAWFALVNFDPYKLRFPGMDDYYPGGARGLVPLRERVREAVRDTSGAAPIEGVSLVDDREALDAWKARAVADQGHAKPKLIILSVSGGALRSGLWVSIVLDRLEQQLPHFGAGVRLITGASGGMVGAAYYLLHRRDSGLSPDGLTPDAPYVPSKWVLDIPRDSLDPVARFLALRDPFLTLLPRVVADDRGMRLENGWKGLGLPFRDLAADEASGAIPSMILSPMMIEDGRRLLISNLDLSALVGSAGDQIGEGVIDGPPRPYSLSALEFARLFPDAGQFHLATGVRMNASFPYVSPAVSLPTTPPRRIFDAGAYDNYGVQVAAAWVGKNFEWLAKWTSGVMLVQIRDSISAEGRLGTNEPPGRLLDRLAGGFRFFTSAAEAAEAARTASAMFRNDEDVVALGARFAADPECGRDFFSTVIFENSAEVTYRPTDPNSWPGDQPVGREVPADVSLDWYISRAERDSLIGAIPSPMGKWTDRAERLGRIAELRRRVEVATGSARAVTLKQLEQAANYERLVELRAWWARP